jgi:hypothetical protein
MMIMINMPMPVKWIVFHIYDAYWYSLTHWGDPITGVNGRQVMHRLGSIIINMLMLVKQYSFTRQRVLLVLTDCGMWAS